MTEMTLYGTKGWGSVLVETQLVWYGLPFSFVDVGDVFKDDAARARLSALNPLGQMPTLVLADGAIMTESAAITLFLADMTGRDDLVPGPGSPARPAFLRWLLFLTSNVYPTYTYVDDPSRFVPLEAARQGFADTVNAYARMLYGLLNETAGAPWFLGERFSALDVYIATMAHWRPGRPWFATHAPALAAITEGTLKLEKLRDVWAENFPHGGE